MENQRKSICSRLLKSVARTTRHESTGEAQRTRVHVRVAGLAIAMVLAGAATANTLTSFSDSSGQNIFYGAAGGGVTHLLWNGSWSVQNWTGNPCCNQPMQAVPEASTNFASFVDFLGEHVVYVGSDQHVHQLLNPGGAPFTDSDLFQGNAANANLAARTVEVYNVNSARYFWVPSSGLSAGGDSFGEFVHYLDENHQLNLLYWFPFAGWQSFNLSQYLTSVQGLTSIAPPIPGSSLPAFSDASMRHVFYVGTDWHVYHVYGGPGPSNWTAEDLTKETSAPYTNKAFTYLTGYNFWAPFGGPLAAYLDGSGEHVFYIANNNHVGHLSGGPGAWTNQDLTVAAGGLSAAPSTALTASSDSGGTRVYYVDANNGISELVYVTTYIWFRGIRYPWLSYWANGTLGGAPADNACPMQQLTRYYNGGEHVYYVDPSGHVDQLWQPATGGAWTFQDLYQTPMTEAGLSFPVGATLATACLIP